MKLFLWDDMSAAQRTRALARPAPRDDRGFDEKVAAIVDAVKKGGDKALRRFSRQFEGRAPQTFRVPAAEIRQAALSIDPELRAAIKRARKNIEVFHKAQYPKPVTVQTMPGVTCVQQWRPIEKVGLYIPGGTAPLFSALLMQAIPARIAGCDRITLCSPPQKNGKIHPVILATAHLCGVTDVFAVGGAQAIAAMAYGTASLAKVDKIFGPGNAYVTRAKQIVAQDAAGAAIDMPAGPSEVMVIAGKGARPAWVAADLLAQAEHGADSHSVLVTNDAAFAVAVRAEVAAQLSRLPRRAIAAQSIGQSRLIVVPDRTTAIEVANRYAPEHLILHDKDAAGYVAKIRHAGSVFVGVWTPESAGDYASGTNHVLPTGGYARAYGGLGTLSFMKSMTVQAITRQGLQKLGPAIMTMAAAEGLAAHADAVNIRLRDAR